MAFREKLRTQLGRGSTSSVDCGPRSVQMAMSFGRKSNSGVPDLRRVRTLMGHPGAQPTNVWDQKQALDAYKHTNAWLNYRDDKVKEALINGSGICLSVSYKVLRQQLNKTGSNTFTGGHSIYLRGTKVNKAGKRIVRMLDPLDDGRRPGIADGRPNGRWVNLWKVRQAAKAFGPGGGRIYSVIVRPVTGVGGTIAPDTFTDDVPVFDPESMEWLELTGTQEPDHDPFTLEDALDTEPGASWEDEPVLDVLEDDGPDDLESVDLDGPE